ncbi:MAG TPA: hypothetical protein VI357_22985 [Mycobacteriales bacterium]
MIDDGVRRWHRFRATEAPDELDRLLADDVVFYSPIVHAHRPPAERKWWR